MAKSRGKSNEFNQRFIELVKDEPILWDSSVYGYTSPAERSLAWTKISSALCLPSELYFIIYIKFIYFF